MTRTDDLLTANTPGTDPSRLFTLLNECVDAAETDPQRLEMMGLMLARLQARVQVARIRCEPLEESGAY